MSWKTLAFVGLIGFGLFQHLQNRPVDPGPGAIAPAIPRQSDDGSASFAFKGYTLRPMQSFQIKARVLASETYRVGREADLSPIDLVLGWGRMSDSAVLDKIRISQSNRFYFWRVSEFPIPREEIERSSANMHMIPANDAIASALKRVRPGQVVQVEGWLVEAKAATAGFGAARSRATTRVRVHANSFMSKAWRSIESAGIKIWRKQCNNVNWAHSPFQPLAWAV